MTWKPSLPLALLIVAAFLIPFLGGQVSTDTLALAPDLGSLLRAVLGGPILQGAEAPLLSHWVLALLVGVGAIVVLVKRRILQLPWTPLTTLLLIFFGLLFASVGLSSFRTVSMGAFDEWASYGIAFFAVVAAVGRQRGPMALLAALFSGCVLLALWGVLIEFPANVLADPGYRLFAGWVNPNAAAGILLIGFFLGLGLLVTAQRLESLLCGVGCAAIATALVLTGSKGGIYLGIPAGLVLFLACALVWNSDKKQWLGQAGRVVGCLALGLVLAIGIQARNRPKEGSTSAPLGRLAQYSETQDQSAGFRKLLYKTSVLLIKENPAGYGVGAFHYESSRPGLTTQTQLAHNTLLQIAVEASPVAALTLLGVLGLWWYQMFRGARKLPTSQNLLRASVMAAVLATLGQSLVESNLYYYGIGLAFFMLLGVGMLLASDDVAPEFTPKAARWTSVVVIGLLLVQFFYVGYLEADRAQIRGMGAMQKFDEAREAAKSLTSLAPMDGEAWYLAGYYAASPEERTEAFQRSVESSPHPRAFRALARHLMELKRPADALAPLRRALERDPNNLPALRLKIDVETHLEDLSAAVAAAKKLVEVESTPYYQIRSLPELIPTETAEARIFLADHTADKGEQADLLQGALDTYASYAGKTVPNVKRFAAGDPPLEYAGENVRSATEKLQAGIATAKRLAGLYRSLGLEDRARVAETIGSGLEAALGSLGGPSK